MRPGMTATYNYRTDGLRLNKTVNGVRTTHVWVRGNIVLERNQAGAVINRYIRASHGQLIRSQQHGWYILNTRGDVVQRLGANAAILRAYRYSAFGNELNPDANNNNPWRYGAMYWDFETSTYMTPNRHLNPRTGRWTQPDPWWGIHNMQDSPLAILQAANLYLYVMHNPVMWTDPTGLFAWNERDEQLILVNADTTRNAGGTLTFGTQNGVHYATLSIWGVEVTFRSDADGVNRPNWSSSFFIRADLFYSTIVGAAGGEMAFLGGHNANIPGFSAYHMHIAIFAAYGTDVYSRLLEEGPDSTRWGLRYGFISGTAGGFSRTRGGVNLDTYMTRANRQFFNHIASGAGTGTDLLSGLDHFMGNHSNAFPWNGRWTNSTSFTIGLVNAMGHEHGLSSTQRANSWGINNAFSARYFGR